MRRLAVALLVSGCLLHDEPDGDGPTVAPAPATDTETETPRGSGGLAKVTRAAVEDAREQAAADDDTRANTGPGPIRRPSDGPPAGADPSDLDLFTRAEQARADDRFEDMGEAYLQLLRESPMSPLVPDVYAGLGDYYFGHGKYAEAGKIFDKAMSFPDAPAAVWAHYMLAWCQLQSGDATNALDQFVRAQKAIEAGGYGTGDAAVELAIAIRRDMVRAYAEVGKPSRARAFFERLEGGTGTDDVPVAAQLERLQALLTERGDAEGARTVCRDRLARGESITCGQ